MRKQRLFFLFLIIGFSVRAQYAGYKQVQDLASFRSLFSVAAQKTKSLKSDFVQEKNLSLLSEKITSYGTFWYKKDNLIRMEYTKPFQYLVVINGSNVYIKDGRKENRMSAKSNKLFQQINNIILDCIRGTALSSPNYAIRVFENSPSFLIELTPLAKELKQLFKNINIVVSKKDYMVSKIELHEQSGDNTIITYLHKELNPAIGDALFAIK